MATRGKNYKKVTAEFDRSNVYSLADAVELSLKSSYAKFDESIDLAIKLGVDPRHADQMVRSSVVLPNGIGKETRVLVFAKGDKEKEALDAGADYAGGDPPGAFFLIIGTIVIFVLLLALKSCL